MIYGFIGDCGSGKTMLMTILAHQKQADKQKVFSNYKLSFPFERLTSKFFNNYKDFPIFNAVVLFDELSLYYSSRRSMSKHNQKLKPFILQTRKRSLELYYTAQQFSLVDVNIRDNTDGLYYPSITVARKIKNKTFIFQKSEKYIFQDGDILYLYYEYYKYSGGCLRLVHKKRILINPFFGLYNTNEILDFEEDEENVKKK